ncbi:MAG: hypothetical protein RLZZ352_787 [Pseudomonadota bacterium]|jgi:opacity protein-like surface antigen
MKKLVIASALALAGMAAQAQAVYGDIAYQMIDTDLSTDPAVLRGIVGYEINPNMAVEGMLGLNIKDGKEDFGTGIEGKAKVDHLIGVYAKPKLKVNDALELYGRVGFVSYKVKASAFGFSESDSGSDLSFGVGASYNLTPNLSLNVDFMDFGDLEGGVAFGLKFKF